MTAARFSGDRSGRRPRRSRLSASISSWRTVARSTWRARSVSRRRRVLSERSRRRARGASVSMSGGRCWSGSGPGATTAEVAEAVAESDTWRSARAARSALWSDSYVASTREADSDSLASRARRCHPISTSLRSARALLSEASCCARSAWERSIPRRRASSSETRRSASVRACAAAVRARWRSSSAWRARISAGVSAGGGGGPSRPRPGGTCGGRGSPFGARSAGRRR